jgi:CheY-like chemotaxis protein
MTANAFAKDREQALKAGMNEHISKPVSIDKLISTLSEFISK